MTDKTDLIMAWVWDLPYPSKHNGKAEWSSAIFPAEQDCAEYLLATPERLAAPDLLAALEAADAHFGPFADITINGAHDPEDVRVVALIRAAIAKARGQV